MVRTSGRSATGQRSTDHPGRPSARCRLLLTHAVCFPVRLGIKAGVQDCHPHRFRHTFAVNFLRNGGNAFELQMACRPYPEHPLRSPVLLQYSV